jgi:hypothetical protein
MRPHVPLRATVLLSRGVEGAGAGAGEEALCARVRGVSDRVADAQRCPSRHQRRRRFGVRVSSPRLRVVTVAYRDVN